MLDGPLEPAEVLQAARVAFRRDAFPHRPENDDGKGSADLVEQFIVCGKHRGRRIEIGNGLSRVDIEHHLIDFTLNHHMGYRFILLGKSEFPRIAYPILEVIDKRMGIHVEQVMAEHTGEKSCVDPPIFRIGAFGNEVDPFLKKPGGIVFVHLASQIDIAADPGAEKRIEQGIGTLIPNIKRIGLLLIADVRSEPFQNAFSKHVVGDIGGQRPPPPPFLLT